MNELYQSLPFIAAIVLLITSVVKLRQFLFIASFAVLFAGCLVALAIDGSSGAFGFMGGFILLFGIVCLFLSRHIERGNFVSSSGLRAIGVIFFFLGLAGTMIT